MITTKKWLKAVGYNIHTTDMYMWECYGPNAYFMETEWLDYQKFTGCTLGIIRDQKTNEVYEAYVWEYFELGESKAYRWINPKYKKLNKKEYKKREVQFNYATEDTKWIKLTSKQLLKLAKKLSDEKKEES